MDVLEFVVAYQIICRSGHGRPHPIRHATPFMLLKCIDCACLAAIEPERDVFMTAAGLLGATLTPKFAEFLANKKRLFVVAIGLVRRSLPSPGRAVSVTRPGFAQKSR
jgi:hypothetical protein